MKEMVDEVRIFGREPRDHFLKLLNTEFGPFLEHVVFAGQGEEEEHGARQLTHLHVQALGVDLHASPDFGGKIHDQMLADQTPARSRTSSQLLSLRRSVSSLLK